MFPDAEFLGTDLYWWMMITGVVVALVAFRLLQRHAGISDRVFNFSVILAVAAFAAGYLFALLFQSWYAFLETGVYRFGVGATFYGGLIGGVLIFVTGYFAVGHFLFGDGRHIAEFWSVVAALMPCTAAAHAFGRLGCLFDGCCYGAPTDSFIGIYMFTDGEWVKRVPVQLFESIFLAALFCGMVLMIKFKLTDYTPSAYLIGYGVWRFFIEYARDDADRYSSGISFLTPSQLTAIILTLCGIAFIFVYKYVLRSAFARMAAAKASAKTAASAEHSAERGENAETTTAQAQKGETESESEKEGESERSDKGE